LLKQYFCERIQFIFEAALFSKHKAIFQSNMPYGLHLAWSYNNLEKMNPQGMPVTNQEVFHGQTSLKM
jgi:hypothetical protein